MRHNLVFFKNVGFHCWHCTSACRERRKKNFLILYLYIDDVMISKFSTTFISKSPWYSWNIVESDVKQHNPNTPFQKERWCWILPVLYGYSWYILSSQESLSNVRYYHHVASVIVVIVSKTIWFWHLTYGSCQGVCPLNVRLSVHLHYNNTQTKQKQIISHY